MFRMLRSAVLIGAAVGVAHVGILRVRVVGSTAPSGGGGVVDGRRCRRRSARSKRTRAATITASRARSSKRKRRPRRAATPRRRSAKAKSEYREVAQGLQERGEAQPEARFRPTTAWAYAYRKTGDYAKALEMYDQAIELAKPDFSRGGRVSRRSVPRAQSDRRCAAGVSGSVRASIASRPTS